jgi:serine/threonine-protein kinase
MARFAPGDRLDSYDIVALLGAGAYNESYRALDRRDGRTVVLKVPDPNLFADPATYNRYKREAEVAKRLRHPALQGAIDNGEKRSEPYLVLTFVDGGSLKDRIRQGVPIATAIDWGRQLADAIAYLHGEGIIHRDLKPGNVLVGPDDRLVIADFGTAQLAGARRLTFKHLTGMLGTTEYMSPEQAQGGRGDARSDIYAWGVMMYEMLTGLTPFTGSDWMAIMAAHLQNDPKPIHQTRHDVPPGLEAVVMHAMRRHPENRYQTADELRADLDRVDLLAGNAYDLSPERPLGSLGVGSGGKGLFSRFFKPR